MRNGDLTVKAVMFGLWCVSLLGMHGIAGEAPEAVDGEAAYVEPLPEGATARMGVSRFRAAGQLHGIQLSPDGRILTTLNVAGTLRVWDAQSGRLVSQFVYYTRPDRDRTFHLPAALSHDAKTLAISEQGTIVLYDANTCQKRPWKSGPASLGNVLALQFTSDDAALIAVGTDETQALSVESGRRITEFDVPSALTADRLTKGEVRRSEAGRAVGEYWNRQALGPPDFEKLEFLALSADRSLLAAASLMHGNRVHLFKLLRDTDGSLDVREHLPDDGHRAGIKDLQFVGRGDELLSTSIDDSAMIWNVAARRPRTRIEKAYRAAASSDGRLLAVYGLNSGAGVRLFNIAMADDPELLSVRKGGGDVAVSPAGTQLAYMQSSSLVVERIATGEIARRIELEVASAYGVALSNDGELVARAYRHPEVWDIETGERRLAATSGSQHTMILSPDGRRLVTRAKAPVPSGSIQVWSTVTGRLLRKFGGEVKLRCGAVMRDNRRLIGGCQDGKLRVWDLESGKLLTTFPGHRRYLMAVALSPDETTFASGSIDSEILLWDAKRIPTP